MGDQLPTIIYGPIARADLPGLSERLCALLGEPGSELCCDVRNVRPDATTVEALARLQVAAGRRGCRVRLSNVYADLATVVEMMGLTHVLLAGRRHSRREALGEPEQWEEPSG